MPKLLNIFLIIKINIPTDAPLYVNFLTTPEYFEQFLTLHTYI